MLGPSEGGVGGPDAQDGFLASGRNAYPSGANAFFADAHPIQPCNFMNNIPLGMNLIPPDS